ncbi:MAG TPA: SDR family NAD(P)-dependent oxidoreductase [Steroidobacteraceae bacterium]|nr:SDR family NAD(P)-dependent oxidoreductase [Steroidobacteraceae bacterium]
MNFAMLKKVAGFYGRFLVSFSAIGYRARALTWQPLPGDFKGQTWIVTGATAGIGRATVEGATRRGATVLALARSREKLDALVRSSIGPGRVIPLVVDLSLVADTRRAAAEIIAQGTRVDVLVNNVGLLLDDLSTTTEGFETSYATNLLTHWVLTEALLQGSALAPQATIIEMSSGGMYNAPLTLDYMNMKDPRKYNGVYAYAVHKRGQAELVKYWQKRHGAGGMRCYVMHPGWADTDGVKTAMPNFRRRLRSVLRDSAQGADTALWLAAARPANEGGEAFWFDRAPRAAHAFPHTVKSKYTPDDLAAFLAKEAAKVGEVESRSAVGQALA